jgi:hypothetical protein
MVTDEMVDAMSLMMEECDDIIQQFGMYQIKRMLINFDEDRWMNMSEQEKRNFVRKYLR